MKARLTRKCYVPAPLWGEGVMRRLWIAYIKGVK